MKKKKEFEPDTAKKIINAGNTDFIVEYSTVCKRDDDGELVRDFEKETAAAETQPDDEKDGQFAYFKQQNRIRAVAFYHHIGDDRYIQIEFNRKTLQSLMRQIDELEDEELPSVREDHTDES